MKWKREEADGGLQTVAPKMPPLLACAASHNEILPVAVHWFTLPSIDSIAYHLSTNDRLYQYQPPHSFSSLQKINHVRSITARDKPRHNVAGSTQLHQTATTRPSRITLRPIQRLQRRQRSTHPCKGITRYHPHRWGGRSTNHDPAH